MNYLKHYERLIERAQTRSILPGEYFETHHIVPKCLGGTNDIENIVNLFPEEHYVAHQLLIKIYPGERKLVFAAHMMTVNSPTQKRNNKSFGWIKRKHAMLLVGIPKSLEHRAKISQSLIGKPSPSKTAPKTPEQRKKMSMAKLNVPKSENHRQSLSTFLINLPTLQCPHCSLSGRYGPMRRWHFDNCKSIIHSWR